MRPRNYARPAAAGALCFAFSCAGAQAALAQTDTTSSTPQPAAHAAARRRGSAYAIASSTCARASAQWSPAKVTPVVAGLTVSLQVKRGRGWRTIDRDRTDAAGRYKLRERLRSTGSRRARVRVAGAPGVLPGKRRLGRLNVFRYA